MLPLSASCRVAMVRIKDDFPAPLGPITVITLPGAGYALGEVTVQSRFFGTPDQKFAREALETIPKMVADVRTQLGFDPGFDFIRGDALLLLEFCHLAFRCQ